MGRIKQGAYRLPKQFFSWTAILVALVLTVPPAFSQQKKVTLTPEAEVVSDANDRIAQLAGAAAVRQGDYTIGPGDLLTIEVFDVPELSREVRVNESGTISLPLMPVKVHAEGLTTAQLQDKLAELLQTNGLVSSPEVSVTLKERNSKPITIIGSVKNPMVIQAFQSTSLLQALSQAGGISADAGNIVIVTRPPAKPSAAEEGGEQAAAVPAEAQSFTINLKDLLDSGDARFNITLLGGDVVSVPRAGIIYVVGAVNHPGGFVIDNDRDRMTVMKMLSLAGGPIGSAKIKSAVILRKNGESGKRDELPVNLNKVMQLKAEDLTLQASDILFVPDSSSKRAWHRAGDVALSLTTGAAIMNSTRF